MRAILLCLLLALRLNAANWYVDNVSTNNYGTNWANAWTNFNAIVWESVNAGDSVFISGGTESKGYTNIFYINKGGTAANPITIRVGQDAGHNGLVYITNSIVIASAVYSNIVVDGARSPTFSTNDINPVTPWGITNNIGIYVCPSNAPVVASTQQGIYVRAGSGIKLRWLDIHCGADTNMLNNGILWDLAMSGDGQRWRDNCEIGYCYIHHNTKDGLYDASASYYNAMGALVVHHNIIMWNADDGAECVSGIDFCYNRIGELHPLFDTGHPDGIQNPGFNVRIYNNIITTCNNSATYCLPLADWGAFYGGNRYFYGNVIYRDNTNHSPGDLINLAPRNYNYGTNSEMQWTNIVFLNNTLCASGPGVAGIKWGGFSCDVAEWSTNSTYQTLSNSWALNNVNWRISQGLISQSAISVMAPCDVDYNTVDSSGGVGSTRMLISPDAIHHGNNIGDNPSLVYETPELYNVGQSKVSNITATVTFANTNLGAFDFRLQASDTGARNRGLDLSTYLPAAVLADMPDYDKDLLGNTRGADGAWDRGAFEYTPEAVVDSLTNGLLLWLTFEDDFEDGQVDDQSGNERHMLRYGFASTPTNWPSRVVSTNVRWPGYAAQFIPQYTNWYPEGQTTYANGEYGAVTNLGVMHEPGLTNMTISVWANYYSYTNDFGVYGNDQNCQLLNAGWGNDNYMTNGAWSFGRSYYMATYGTYFSVYTNAPFSSDIVWARFPDDVYAPPQRGASGWNHYVVTVDCAAHTINAYFNGTNCWTTVLPDHIPAIIVSGTDTNPGDENGFPWLALGVMTHNGSATQDDVPYQPNAYWMHGEMDDVRIYNRVLTGSEITTLFGASSARRIRAGTLQVGTIR